MKKNIILVVLLTFGYIFSKAQTNLYVSGTPIYSEEVEMTSYTILPDDLNVATADPFDLVDIRSRTIRTKTEWFMINGIWTIKTTYLQLPYYFSDMHMNLGY